MALVDDLERAAQSASGYGQVTAVLPAEPSTQRAYAKADALNKSPTVDDDAHKVLFGQTVANAIGISGSDLDCLDFVNLEGRVTAGWLAEITGLTSGAITGVGDRLEKELPVGEQWSAYDKALGGGAYFAPPTDARREAA